MISEQERGLLLASNSNGIDLAGGQFESMEGSLVGSIQGEICGLKDLVALNGLHICGLGVDFYAGTIVRSRILDVEILDHEDAQMEERGFK